MGGNLLFADGKKKKNGFVVKALEGIVKGSERRKQRRIQQGKKPRMSLVDSIVAKMFENIFPDTEDLRKMLRAGLLSDIISRQGTGGAKVLKTAIQLYMQNARK